MAAPRGDDVHGHASVKQHGLMAYVTAVAASQLWNGTGEEFSWPGFIVALVAIPAMRYLAQRKIAIAEKIGNRALRADAMEAVTCGWLSLVVVVSLAAQWLLGHVVD